MHSSLDWPQSVPQAPPVFHQTADWRERQQVLGSPGRTVFVSSLNGPAGETAWLSHQRVRPSRDPASEIRSLQQHYTILDDQPLIRLTSEEPVLVPLLMEAVAPLKNAFGEMPVLQVRVQSSDDDSLVKVAVQLPADLAGEPERALRSFDEHWWLKNCHRSSGTLVFDYEIQDAV